MYDAVGIFASTWNSSVRSEAQIRGTGDLTRAGFLEDAVKGKVSCHESMRHEYDLESRLRMPNANIFCLRRLLFVTFGVYRAQLSN